MIIAIVLIYLVSAFLAWGITLGSFTKEFPEFDNTDVARFAAVLGPLGLFATLLSMIGSDGVFGFQVIPYSTEKRWEIHQQKYPCLGREYFR